MANLWSYYLRQVIEGMGELHLKQYMSNWWSYVTECALNPEQVIEGMGELHLDIIVDRLKREFNVDCKVGAPQVRFPRGL